jgi:hypothetical protein
LKKKKKKEKKEKKKKKRKRKPGEDQGEKEGVDDQLIDCPRERTLITRLA